MRNSPYHINNPLIHSRNSTIMGPSRVRKGQVRVISKLSPMFPSLVSAKWTWKLKNDILENERRLLQRLGLSFFLFGLINNGKNYANFQTSLTSWAYYSSLCHYHVSCARSCTSFHTQRDHCFLEHCTCTCSQDWLAISLERQDKIYQTCNWVLCVELLWNDR